MKLLDNANFTRMAQALTDVHTHTALVAQLESYSCKMAGADKRLYKQISNEGPTSELEILASPSAFEVKWVKRLKFNSQVSSLGRSPGTLCNACSKKTLYYLKATLNAAFPDYDFRFGYHLIEMPLVLVFPPLLTLKPCPLR